MSARINYTRHSAELQKMLMNLSQANKLDATLHHLTDIRASQINGCTFCLDMHVKEAKIHGERDLRLHHIAAWRESHLFTPKERAALEWTEAITLVAEHKLTDELFKKVSEHLSEKELSDLTFSVGIINLWNRLNVSSPQTPGSLDAMFGLHKAGLE